MNREKIRKFNQENDGKFIISCSELVIPNHQLPPESVQLSACWEEGNGRKNSWEDDHHCYMCNNCSKIREFIGFDYRQEHAPRLENGRLNFFSLSLSEWFLLLTNIILKII